MKFQEIRIQDLKHIDCEPDRRLDKESLYDLQKSIDVYGLMVPIIVDGDVTDWSIKHGMFGELMRIEKTNSPIGAWKRNIELDRPMKKRTVYE